MRINNDITVDVPATNIYYTIRLAKIAIGNILDAKHVLNIEAIAIALHVRVWNPCQLQTMERT